MEHIYLVHHGIDGQKWGKRNGPPYPLDSNPKRQAQRKRNSMSSSGNDEVSNRKRSQRNENYSRNTNNRRYRQETDRNPLSKKQRHYTNAGLSQINDQELNYLIDRLDREKKYRELTKNPYAERVLNKVLDKTVDVTVSSALASLGFSKNGISWASPSNSNDGNYKRKNNK